MLYRLSDVEAYERARTFSSTAEERAGNALSGHLSQRRLRSDSGRSGARSLTACSAPPNPCDGGTVSRASVSSPSARP